MCAVAMRLTPARPRCRLMPDSSTECNPATVLWLTTISPMAGIFQIYSLSMQMAMVNMTKAKKSLGHRIRTRCLWAKAAAAICTGLMLDLA